MRATLVPVAVAFVSTIALVDMLSPEPPPVAPRRAETLDATVIDARAAAGEEATLVTLRLGDGANASATLFGPAPIVGERLRLHARRDVFDEPRNPGEPSEREMEAERGVTWRLIRPVILARAPPDSRDASLWIPRLRAWASSRLHADMPEPDATILAGAMWGERGTLPRDLRAEFQDTGTVHVLVTAGLHLGVVAALALGLLSWLGAGRIGASLVTIALVWLYAAFSGGHLPSERAATMLTFALIARACGREAFSWNALAAAAIAVAAMRPHAVTSISFALSFSCVAAIFAFAEPCTKMLERTGIAHGVASIFGVSLATQIGTWPLTASAFLVIAPYAPLANACVVPLVGVAMLGGFATLLASPMPLVAHGFANVDATILDAMSLAVRTFGGLPGAHIIATPPPLWAIAAYDVAAIAAAVAYSRNRAALAIGIIAAAAALCLWPPRADRHELVVTAIDVGQADALLVQTPGGRAYLVDAGGRLERGSSADSTAEDVGERVVVPFLIRAGIHHLDAVLLSHPHGDHAGGIAPVLRTLGAGAFADSGQSYPGHAYRDALDVAHSSHTTMLEPRGGDVWQTGDGVTFRFYGPTYPYITRSRSDINSNSLVFRVEYGNVRMLFTGDAGTEAEARFLTRYDDLRADVLKVGHHGSAYGTTEAFVRAVRPSVAIISVGRHNLFGHPADSTLRTLRESGARIYRTDENGAIVMRSDGSHVEVSPFLRSDE